MGDTQPQETQPEASKQKPVPKNIWTYSSVKTAFERKKRWIRRYPSHEYQEARVGEDPRRLYEEAARTYMRENRDGGGHPTWAERTQSAKRWWTEETEHKRAIYSPNLFEYSDQLSRGLVPRDEISDWPRSEEQIFIDRMGRTREIDTSEVEFRVVNYRKGSEVDAQDKADVDPFDNSRPAPTIPQHILEDQIPNRPLRFANEEPVRTRPEQATSVQEQPDPVNTGDGERPPQPDVSQPYVSQPDVPDSKSPADGSDEEVDIDHYDFTDDVNPEEAELFEPEDLHIGRVGSPDRLSRADHWLRWEVSQLDPQTHQELPQGFTLHPGRPWSSEDEVWLFDRIHEDREEDFGRIAQELQRTESQCHERYRRIACLEVENPRVGRWNANDDDTLLHMINDLDICDWDRIAFWCNTTPEDCQERWRQHGGTFPLSEATKYPSQVENVNPTVPWHAGRPIDDRVENSDREAFYKRLRTEIREASGAERGKLQAMYDLTLLRDGIRPPRTPSISPLSEVAPAEGGPAEAASTNTDQGPTTLAEAHQPDQPGEEAVDNSNLGVNSAASVGASAIPSSAAPAASEGNGRAATPVEHAQPTRNSGNAEENNSARQKRRREKSKSPQEESSNKRVKVTKHIDSEQPADPPQTQAAATPAEVARTGRKRSREEDEDGSPEEGIYLRLRGRKVPRTGSLLEASKASEEVSPPEGGGQETVAPASQALDEQQQGAENTDERENTTGQSPENEQTQEGQIVEKEGENGGEHIRDENKEASQERAAVQQEVEKVNKGEENTEQTPKIQGDQEEERAEEEEANDRSEHGQVESAEAGQEGLQNQQEVDNVDEGGANADHSPDVGNDQQGQGPEQEEEDSSEYDQNTDQQANQQSTQNQPVPPPPQAPTLRRSARSNKGQITRDSNYVYYTSSQRTLPAAPPAPSTGSRKSRKTRSKTKKTAAAPSGVTKTSQRKHPKKRGRRG